jgi:hypothetical protein
MSFCLTLFLIIYLSHANILSEFFWLFMHNFIGMRFVHKFSGLRFAQGGKPLVHRCTALGNLTDRFFRLMLNLTIHQLGILVGTVQSYALLLNVFESAGFVLLQAFFSRLCIVSILQSKTQSCTT